jgi:hypothetical protein
MAEMGKTQRKDGKSQTQFKPIEVFGEMILRRLFSADEAQTFKEVRAEAQKRGLIWSGFSGEISLSS